MDNQILKYYINEYKKYKEVKILEEYILFENSSESGTKQFSAHEIIDLSNSLGKSLLENIDLNSFDITNKPNIVNTFVSFYKKTGFITNNSQNNNIPIISFDELEFLAKFFTKFHILYTVFNTISLSYITEAQLENLIKYTEFLNLNSVNINTSNYKKIYYDFVKIIESYLNYEIKIKFDFDFDDYGIYTKVISSNICDLCVFVFINLVGSNIKGRKSICKNCGNPYLKTGKKQYYCPKCRSTRNYNKTLDEKKLEIIHKLESQYNHYEFSKDISEKLRYYIKLKQDSRLRLRTKLKELRLFLDTTTNSRIKEKSIINSGYIDY